MTRQADFIARISRALGRTQPSAAVPAPPELAEPVIRLVHSDIGLPALFAQQAAANAMTVTTLAVEDLAARLIDVLRQLECTRIALPVSTLLDSLEIPRQLNEAGLIARRWDELTADEVFEFDAGVTDVYAAVAETGSLVIRAEPAHGRALSLVPPVHIAIVQPRDLVGDLLDLLRKLERDGAASGTVLITGPSKTTDIEGNLVTGVHGPGTVHVLLLE